MPATVETRALDAPGATLTYDIHPATSPSEHPPLFILGSPMEAAAFATLAGHFTDRTVLTYDPRGTGRSPLADPVGETDPAQHAADLQRVLDDAKLDRVDVFATSGGAVNALAWIARHRPAVRTLVAHEPPTAQFLPDRETVLAVVTDMADTYQADGEGPAMAKFIALVSQQGPLPADYLDGPAPDPAMFGLPADDNGSRTNPLLGLNMRTCSAYEHDIAALHASTTRIVIATGATSGQQFAARAADAFAANGFEHTLVPGDHTGFLGGEHGQYGEPDAFAAALHQILDNN
ncbi:alpha/beta hydrolase [Nocardia sp. NPDC005366]|uniref:alpha/beta fold hydrolase n=1 Tax=Nocardia sp. NPDC005366 TaxID=3156878 RepID=UPI0033A4098F